MCGPFSLEQSHQTTGAKVIEAFDVGAVPVALGGDHFVTLSSTTAVTQRYGAGNIGIVHFDAHADTRDSLPFTPYTLRVLSVITSAARNLWHLPRACRRGTPCT